MWSTSTTCTRPTPQGSSANSCQWVSSHEKCASDESPRPQCPPEYLYDPNKDVQNASTEIAALTVDLSDLKHSLQPRTRTSAQRTETCREQSQTHVQCDHRVAHDGLAPSHCCFEPAWSTCAVPDDAQRTTYLIQRGHRCSVTHYSQHEDPWSEGCEGTQRFAGEHHPERFQDRPQQEECPADSIPSWNSP